MTDETITIDINMMPRFTKEELYEIEKVFDLYVSMNMNGMADIANKYAQLKTPKSDEVVDKLLDSALSQHHTYRMISAKASKIRSMTME